MKNTIRAFLIGLALVLCLIPALVACDPAASVDETPGETTVADGVGDASSDQPNAAYEGTPVAKADNIPKTMVLTLHKLSETDASGVTKCSLVLTDSEGTVLNYVTFDFVGGKAPSILSLKRTEWFEESCTAHIAHADGTTQTLDLAYSK